MALAASSSGQTDPPASGDWVVSDNTYWNTNLVLTGNLTVNNSANLELDGMTLTMSGPWDGALGIYVEAGSTLNMTNVNVRSSDGAVHYWFECRGPVYFDNCDVRDVAANASRYDDWDNIAGGVQIYDGASELRDSDFHDCQRINVYVSGCEPLIDNCDFYNAEYVSTYQRLIYDYEIRDYIQGWYTDATGLYLYQADPDITLCTFRNNGLRGTALPFYTTSYSVSIVATYGRGILAADSSPNITQCEFQQNGDQPNDRNVEGVQQIFIEQIYYSDLVPEGGMVCIGSSRPTVYRSSFLTNDLFGIYGAEGGLPDLVESCRIEGNRYIRGNYVNAPSGGIYLEDTSSGTIWVANSTAGGNYVLANIYLEAASLRLINFTNSNNVVNGAYNIYVSGGTHVFKDCMLDGRPGLYANVQIGYSRAGNPKLRFEGCTLIGASYGMHNQNYQGASATFANSTISNTGTATFYLQSTNVDCINCTIAPLRIESYLYGRGSTVRIMYYLEIRVTWQNDKPVAGAFVQLFNATKDFLYGGITDENGTIGPLVVTSRTILASYNQESDVSNSPLYVGAYSAGLESRADSNKHVFTQNLIGKNAIHVIINDHVAPTIYVFTPSPGHSQNSTTLEVRGMTTDVGAGVNSTYVTVDDGTEWNLVAGDEQTWTTELELTEGVHTIHIRSVDKAGNEKVMSIEGVEIDLSPPLLEVIDPVKRVWYTSAENYTLRGRVNGAVSLVINRQPVEVAPDGTWESHQNIYAGTNEFTIIATDHVGNTFVVMKSIVSDTTEPKLILTSPEDGMWTNISQLEVKGITELRATVLVNGEPLLTFDGRFATNIFLTEGMNRIIVEAIDGAKNMKREERIVYLDSIPPALQVESPRANALVSTRFLPVSGTIDDPSVTHVIVNGLMVPVVDQRFEKEFRLDEGENPIVIEVWDGARNYASRSYMIVLDTTPPRLTLAEPLPGLETQEPTVRIRGTVDADSILLIWGEPLHDDFDIINLVRIETNYRYDQYPLVLGVNTIHLEAEDAVGNVARMTFQIIYDVEPPSLMVSPMAERTTREVVTVSGMVIGGAEVRINGVPGVLGPNGEFAESIHLKSGKNSIKVVAHDAAGNRVEATVNVTRTAVEPPEEGIAGAGIAFSLGLVIVMLVIGMAILYPGVRGGSIEPEAMLGEPIIITDEWEEPEPETEEEPGPLSQKPPWQDEGDHRRPPPPPPDHRRPPPPPSQEQPPEAPPDVEGSGLPPKPPWHD